MVNIGQVNSLELLRFAGPGAFVDGQELGEILLPKRYVPSRAAAGDFLDLFVYRDSEDRLVATTERPIASVGQFAALRVVGIHPTAGAFLDWGLEKDLLLPYREQVQPVRVGDHVVVYVMLDEKSGRVVATAKFNKHLNKDFPEVLPRQQVDLIVINATPLGYSVLVQGGHLGLLHRERVFQPLQPGDSLNGYVVAVHPDGKIDLSLEPTGYRRVKSLADRIVEELERCGGRIEFDDDSSPDAVRSAFNASKKAFKQALGALYRQRRIRFVRSGTELEPGGGADWNVGSESEGEREA
jgi:uncharacterized protein